MKEKVRKEFFQVFGSMVIVSSILLVSVNSVFADETKTAAAVMDLEAKEGVSAGLVSTISDYLRTQLVNTNRFTIVTRENMESILKEQKLQLSGCTSQECIVQMGQLLGVRKMFTGSIGKVGSIFLVNLKIIDVQSGRIEKAESSEESRSEEELLAAMRRLAKMMAGLAVPAPQVSGPAPYREGPVAAPSYAAPQPYAAVAPAPYVPQAKLEKFGIGAYWSMWEMMAKPLPPETYLRRVVPYGAQYNDLGGNLVPAITFKWYNSGQGNDGRVDFAVKSFLNDMKSVTVSIVPGSWHLVPEMSSPVQVYIDLGIDIWIGWGEITNWIYNYFDIGEGFHVKGGVEFFAGPVSFFFEGGVGIEIMDLEIWEDAWGESYDSSTFFERLYYPLNFGARVYF